VSVKVYDWEGNERDLAYLKGKYGDFVIQPAASGQKPVYEIAALRENVNAPAALIVCVTDKDGAPLEGIRIAWYWPDAPLDPDAGPLGGVLPQMEPGRCVTGVTNAGGDTGFGMGAGAYYWPGQAQIGPHATWIHGADTRSDLILGLGMVAATNHDHFDVEFARFDQEPEPPEPPEPPQPPECPTEEILAELGKIDRAVRAIRQLLE